MEDGKKRAGQAADQADAGWQYRPDSGADLAASEMDDAVEWSASEFVAHEKSFGWYAVLFLLTALVSAGLYLATRDIVSVVVVVIMAIILGVAGARKPRVITYRLDQSGLTAGKRFYPYGAYKSFAMPEDGPFTYVVLIPLKRFDFPVSAFLAPDSQQKALDVLSNHLPLERGELDVIDQLMRQLRF